MSRRASTLRILVAGRLAGVAGQAGATWAVLQYVLGLRRLGHHVVFVEPVERADGPLRRYFTAVTREFGLQDCCHLLVAGGSAARAAVERRLAALAGGCDLLLDISGTLGGWEAAAPIATRAYLDLDPAFTQLWSRQGWDVGLDGHTHYVSVGHNLGREGCDVPLCGRDWLATVPPVVLEQWPVEASPASYGLTSVANWRAYGSIEADGVLYGQKAHSLRRLIELPHHVAPSLTLALTIHEQETRDLEALRAHGWRLADPFAVAGTPADYRRFIAASWAEFGVAKSGYVVSRCGWFSDRSVCYLASGRPVLAQDTGFGTWLPAGEGLLAFRDLEEATAAVEDLAGDYPRHARAARDLAQEFFDSDRVLARLLDSLGAAA